MITFLVIMLGLYTFCLYFGSDSEQRPLKPFNQWLDLYLFLFLPTLALVICGDMLPAHHSTDTYHPWYVDLVMGLFVLHLPIQGITIRAAKGRRGFVFFFSVLQLGFALILGFAIVIYVTGTWP